MAQEELQGIPKKLVEDGLMKESDAYIYLRNSRDENLEFVSYVLNLGLVPDSDFARFCAKFTGLKFVDLSTVDPNNCPRENIDEKTVFNFGIMPISYAKGKLVVGVSNPANIKNTNSLKFGFGGRPVNIEVVIVEHRKLLEMMDKVYGKFDFFKDIDNADLVSDIMAEEGGESDTPGEEFVTNIADSPNPIIRLINKLLVEAINMKASDLHFEPFEKYYRIRFRVDGVLKYITQTPNPVAVRLNSRLKIMSGMDISEKRNPQDGRIRLKLGNKSIDFRVNSLPTVYGEKIVLRILDGSVAKLGIDSLGYEPEQKALFMEALHKPQGMILITGPTGSGKTVSLYTGLNILNTMDTNISTAEDPVEIKLDGVNQVNVNNKTGLNFASVLRALLRQDPDVIMVGEIRDLETAEISIKAAQTGHMVLSTLHTNSAPETLTRLINMGVPSFNLATSVNLVIAQRLARRLCISCKQDAEYPTSVLYEAGFTEEEINSPGFKIYKAVGCSECNDGYKGRVGVYEVMKVTPVISKLIMNKGNAIEIAEASQKEGFANLRRSGLNKVVEGLTTIQEIARITSE